MKYRAKILLWISRIVIVVALVPLLVQPLCDCPRYFVLVSALGLVPLACGPRLYRWLGASYVVIALLLAYMNYSSARHMRAQTERASAGAAQHHP